MLNMVTSTQPIRTQYYYALYSTYNFLHPATELHYYKDEGVKYVKRHDRTILEITEILTLTRRNLFMKLLTFMFEDTDDVVRSYKKNI